jgi:hypothetical protein
MHTLLVCVIRTLKLQQLREQTLKVTLSNIVGSKTLQTQIVYIDDFDPDAIDSQVLASMVKLEPLQTGKVFDGMVKNLHVKQVSQVLKHYKAYQLFAKSSADWLLVIEDDTLTSQGVADILNKLMNNSSLQAEFDIINLSCPIPMTIANSEGLHEITQHFRFTPTVDAYLVKKEAAIKLAESYIPVHFAQTTQLSFVADKLGLKIGMHVPNLFVNGSKLGVYLSSLEVNNRLFMNTDYNKMFSIMTKPVITDEDMKEVMNILSQTSFKDHPDFQYQLAILHMRRGEYAKSKELMEKVYNIYTENDCILNSESEFLLNYTRIFRFDQDKP